MAGALSDSIENVQGLLPASKAELKSQVGTLAARDIALENRDDQLEKTVNLLVSKINSLTPVSSNMPSKSTILLQASHFIAQFYIFVVHTSAICLQGFNGTNGIDGVTGSTGGSLHPSYFFSNTPENNIINGAAKAV